MAKAAGSRVGAKKPKKEAAASFPVGKGKPPKATQFQKGKSGNPAGRTKGSQNLTTLLQQAAYDQIVVTTKSGEKKKLSRIQATTLQFANKAAQGDMKAMLSFMDWVDEIERRAASARPIEPTIGEADLEVLRTIYERMKLCETPKAP
jgi:hypothetical protein